MDGSMKTSTAPGLPAIPPVGDISGMAPRRARQVIRRVCAP